MRLYDGCKVPACAVCYKQLEYGKKLAESRGIFDPSEINTNPIRGGDNMVVIPRGNTGGDNIKAEFAEEHKLTQLKILNEGELDTWTPKEGEEGKPTTRLLVEISYEGQKKDDPKHWRMNDKSRNALMDIWGDDTEKFVGKIVDITYAGEGDFRHIAVDTLRTKKDQ